MTDTERIAELERLVADLTKDRDAWREMAQRLSSPLPAPLSLPSPNIIPLPWPPHSPNPPVVIPVTHPPLPEPLYPIITCSKHLQ